MKTLKLKNLMRNLALIVAGAFMATLILLPLTTSADDDDDDTDFISPTHRGESYAIRAIDRNLDIFTLTRVGRDPNLVLTLEDFKPQFQREVTYNIRALDGSLGIFALKPAEKDGDVVLALQEKLRRR